LESDSVELVLEPVESALDLGLASAVAAADGEPAELDAVVADGVRPSVVVAVAVAAAAATERDAASVVACPDVAVEAAAAAVVVAASSRTVVVGLACILEVHWSASLMLDPVRVADVGHSCAVKESVEVSVDDEEWRAGRSQLGRQ
jgi:hypothetical protein